MHAIAQPFKRTTSETFRSLKVLSYVYTVYLYVLYNIKCKFASARERDLLHIVL